MFNRERMANLQQIFDFYLSTNPTDWKLRNASNLLIHACQALNVNSAEEIDEDLLEELPAALDRFFKNSPQKAIQDKGMLAEMIGRMGPRENLENVINRLLNDPDENLQQFTLQSLEYYARANFEDVLPYFERYGRGNNALLKQVSAIMIARLSYLLSLEEQIKQLLWRWTQEENKDYVELIFEEIQRQASNSIDSPERKYRYLGMRDWMQQQFEYLR